MDEIKGIYMKKKKFFGIYYKHQTVDGFTLAVIISKSNEGRMIQLITNEKSYLIHDTNSITASFGGIHFDVDQEDIKIKGELFYGPLLKPKKDIMSYYRYLPIECKHNIYSMYHSLSGKIVLNGKEYVFDKGNGYMEGDQGRNFPTKYLWLNAIDEEASLTLAIASIPLGLFTITGITCLLEHKNKEYRFGTYNFAKALCIQKDHVVVKKGKYTLEILVDKKEGHGLKAPVKGDMIRVIHEAPCVPLTYTLKYKDQVILEKKHPYASFEYVFDKG